MSILNSISNAFSKVGSVAKAIFVDNPIAKAVRFVGSAVLGPPLSMVATAVMAPIAFGLKCATAMTSQVLKFVGGARVTKVDEMLNSAAEASTEALFGFYKNFGFYAYIKTAEAIADKSQDILNALNSGREEATSVDAPLVESHDTVKFEEQAKKEIAAQNKKISEEEKKAFEDAEVARRIAGIKADTEARKIAEEASKSSEIEDDEYDPYEPMAPEEPRRDPIGDAMRSGLDPAGSLREARAEGPLRVPQRVIQNP